MLICLKTLWDMCFFHVCGEGWFGLGGRNLQAEPSADTCLNANQIYYRRWNNFLGLMMFVWHHEFLVVFPWFLYTQSKAFVLESCCFFSLAHHVMGYFPPKKDLNPKGICYWGCYQHLQLKNNFNTKKQLILCAVSLLRAGRGQVCGSQQVERKSIERHGNKSGFQRPTFETSFRGGKLSWVAPFDSDPTLWLLDFTVLTLSLDICFLTKLLKHVYLKRILLKIKSVTKTKWSPQKIFSSSCPSGSTCRALLPAPPPAARPADAALYRLGAYRLSGQSPDCSAFEPWWMWHKRHKWNAWRTGWKHHVVCGLLAGEWQEMESIERFLIIFLFLIPRKRIFEK